MRIRRPEFVGFFVGVAAGILVLGLVARIAMRLYAIATSQPTSFSVAGTARLMVAAALGGAAAGALFAFLRQRLPAWPVPIAGACFGAMLFALLYLGIRPPGLGGALLFLLLFSGFGALLDIGWKLTSRRKHSP